MNTLNNGINHRADVHVHVCWLHEKLNKIEFLHCTHFDLSIESSRFKVFSFCFCAVGQYHVNLRSSSLRICKARLLLKQLEDFYQDQRTENVQHRKWM